MSKSVQLQYRFLRFLGNGKEFSGEKNLYQSESTKDAYRCKQQKWWRV